MSDINLRYQCRKIDCAVEVVEWDRCVSYWANEWDGFRKFSFYISDLFQCPISNYYYTSKVTLPQFLQFGQEIVRKQNEIKNLSISDSISNDFPVFLDEQLSTLNVTETLHLNSSGVDSRDYNLANVPKCFNLKYALWFNRKHLLSLENCTLIELDLTRLVHNDVNDFVNLWKSGEFSTLEYFQVSVKFTRNSPIGGLANMKNYSNRMRRIKKIYGHTVNVLEGLVIQRDDGRKADVRWNSPTFKLLVHSESDTFEYVELITLDEL